MPRSFPSKREVVVDSFRLSKQYAQFANSPFETYNSKKNKVLDELVQIKINALAVITCSGRSSRPFVQLNCVQNGSSLLGNIINIAT